MAGIKALSLRRLASDLAAGLEGRLDGLALETDIVTEGERGPVLDLVIGSWLECAIWPLEYVVSMSPVRMKCRHPGDEPCGAPLAAPKGEPPGDAGADDTSFIQYAWKRFWVDYYGKEKVYDSLDALCAGVLDHLADHAAEMARAGKNADGPDLVDSD